MLWFIAPFPHGGHFGCFQILLWLTVVWWMTWYVLLQVDRSLSSVNSRHWLYAEPHPFMTLIVPVCPAQGKAGFCQQCVSLPVYLPTASPAQHCVKFWYFCSLHRWKGKMCMSVFYQWGYMSFQWLCHLYFFYLKLSIFCSCFLCMIAGLFLIRREISCQQYRLQMYLPNLYIAF